MQSTPGHLALIHSSTNAALNNSTRTYDQVKLLSYSKHVFATMTDSAAIEVVITEMFHLEEKDHSLATIYANATVYFQWAMTTWRGSKRSRLTISSSLFDYC